MSTPPFARKPSCRKQNLAPRPLLGIEMEAELVVCLVCAFRHLSSCLRCGSLLPAAHAGSAWRQQIACMHWWSARARFLNLPSRCDEGMVAGEIVGYLGRDQHSPACDLTSPNVLCPAASALAVLALAAGRWGGGGTVQAAGRFGLVDECPLVSAAAGDRKGFGRGCSRSRGCQFGRCISCPVLSCPVATCPVGKREQEDGAGNAGGCISPPLPPPCF